MKKTNPQDELVDCIARNGKILGKMDKHLAHGPGLLHYAVHIFIFDSKNRLVIQKRKKNKLLQPGAFDSSASGHVESGEKLLIAAQRETKEEIGVHVPLHFMGFLTIKDTQKKYINFEKVAYYYGKSNQHIRIQKSELAGFKRVPLKKVNAFIQSNKCSPMLIRGWKKFGKKIIQLAEGK